MAGVAKDLLEDPERFLKAKSESSVIVALNEIAANRGQDSDSTLLILLAKLVRAYPHVWMYVRKLLEFEKPPFQAILDDENCENEPKPEKRRRKSDGKYNY